MHSTTIKHSDQRLLESIKMGDEQVLNKLYSQIRTPFIRWAIKQFRYDKEQSIELYQKTFTIFYLNVKNGKLEELTSTIQTYMIGIGKRVGLEQIKKEKRRKDNSELDATMGELDYSYLDRVHTSHVQEVIQQLLESLDPNCEQVLRLYYFMKYSMESIASKMNYKNDNVAKKKKYQCLEKLRKKVAESGVSQNELFDR